LRPLYDLVVSTVLSSDKVFADDTALPALGPGRGRTKKGDLWCYAVDDRPWCGPSHPAVAYICAEDRKNARPAESLTNFGGVLQADTHHARSIRPSDQIETSTNKTGAAQSSGWTHLSSQRQ